MNINNFKRSFLVFFTFCFILFNITSEENNLITNIQIKTQDNYFPELNPKTKDFYYSPTLSNHFLGFGETILSNVIVWSFNRLVLDSPFSVINGETIKTNFTTPWVWDQDEFYVNHIGHPYQGLIYYTAGRSNNLPIWESFLDTVVGSLSWELIAENELPSYNDIITTTIGALSFGEILHRLYYTVNNKIASFFISPMDSINNLILKNKVNVPYGDITSLHTKLLVGFLNADILFKNTNKYENIKFLPVYGGGEINIVYGNPYGLYTITPYDHFDFNIKISASEHYYNFSLFSDGILASFAPWYDFNCKTTLGISLHYDFLLSTLTNYSKNALSLTAKQNIILPNEWDIKWAMHLNWIMLSASDFYYLFSEFEPTFTLGIPNRIYDLGFGAGTKSSFTVSNPYVGTLNLFINFDWINTIKNSLPDNGSTGYYFIFIGSASYEHIIYKDLSIGLEYDYYFKNAFYDSVEDTFETKQILNTYVKYNFK